MGVVMFFGLLGAVVTTIPSMAAIPTVYSPFNFPLPQAFVKIFFGALTAVVGVIAIGQTGVKQTVRVTPSHGSHRHYFRRRSTSGHAVPRQASWKDH